MALDGILLDLDGTLVDSNDAHVEAWCHAFEANGYKVAPDRVFVEIGKGGDKLVGHVLGREADEHHGDAIREAHGEAYERIVKANGLGAIRGAVALLESLRRRGLKTALATSSKQKHVKLTEDATGVPWRSLVDETVYAEDAAATKPSPDIVSAAVKKLGLAPGQCALIGDSPWDARAAKRAGVAMLGVTSGGNHAKTLAHAGARVLYVDAQEIVTHLDEALERLSPGPLHLDEATANALVGEALRVAEEALAAGEVPIGSVLARGDGTIIARGYNRFNATGEKTAHAEMVAFREARGALEADRRDAILVSTLEPCVMCLGAAMEASIDVSLYALPAPADGGTDRITPPESPENQMPRIIGQVRAKESRALLERWMREPSRNRAQEAYVRDLLAAAS